MPPNTLLPTFFYVKFGMVRLETNIEKDKNNYELCFKLTLFNWQFFVTSSHVQE